MAYILMYVCIWSSTMNILILVWIYVSLSAFYIFPCLFYMENSMTAADLAAQWDGMTDWVCVYFTTYVVLIWYWHIYRIKMYIFQVFHSNIWRVLCTDIWIEHSIIRAASIPRTVSIHLLSRVFKERAPSKLQIEDIQSLPYGGYW